MDKSDKIFLGAIFLIPILFVMFIFKAASDMAADNHICKLYGGIYVKVHGGYECVKDGKIIDLRHLGNKP